MSKPRICPSCSEGVLQTVVSAEIYEIIISSRCNQCSYIGTDSIEREINRRLSYELYDLRKEHEAMKAMELLST